MSAFLNPHLLWGLLLVAAPIIIHLLNKRRFEVHDWAAMDFLLHADVRNRRRVRIEDLILLLLRAAVISAAVFLVARPVVEGFGGKEESVRTIVIDDSFSMDHRPGGPSALEKAREGAAYEVQKGVAAGARVSVRRGTRPSEELGSVEGRVQGGQVVEGGTAGDAPGAGAAAPAPAGSAPTPAESGLRLLSTVRALEASDGALRFAEALDVEAKRIEEEHGREIHAIHLVSDFRRGDWLETSGELKPRLKEALARLSRVGRDRVRLRFQNVGEPRRENTAALRVSPDTPQPVAGVPVTITVEVKNFGSEERRGLSGELEVGDPSNPSHRIPLPSFPPIPPGGTASVETDHVFPAAGEYPLTARIDEDRLARDDRTYAVVVAREALSVLVVDGDPGADRWGGEAGFLSAALAPRGSVATGIRPEVVRQPLAAGLLEGRDVVLLLNCPDVSAAERDLLDRFVRAGGGVGFFLGNRVRAESYREVLGDAGLFPASLKTTVEAAGGARIDFGTLSHPALVVYKGLQDASVERISAARYFDLAAGPGAQVVASYADGARTPALVERALGAGRVALFNISADRDWTDWPTDPSYPVVLQEWVRYLAPRRGEARAVGVGEALGWSVSATAGSSPAGGLAPVVIDPRGAIKPAVQEGAAARFDRTDLAGLYRVGWADAGGSAPAAAERARWFAVNRPPQESDLTAATEGEIRSALAPTGVPFAFSDSEPTGEASQREGDIWRWLATSAGLLLLVELGAAYWFGRR